MIANLLHYIAVLQAPSTHSLSRTTLLKQRNIHNHRGGSQANPTLSQRLLVGELLIVSNVVGAHNGQQSDVQTRELVVSEGGIEKVGCFVLATQVGCC